MGEGEREREMLAYMQTLFDPFELYVLWITFFCFVSTFIVVLVSYLILSYFISFSLPLLCFLRISHDRFVSGTVLRPHIEELCQFGIKTKQISKQVSTSTEDRVDMYMLARLRLGTNSIPLPTVSSSFLASVPLLSLS